MDCVRLFRAACCGKPDCYCRRHRAVSPVVDSHASWPLCVCLDAYARSREVGQARDRTNAVLDGARLGVCGWWWRGSEEQRGVWLM